MRNSGIAQNNIKPTLETWYRETFVWSKNPEKVGSDRRQFRPKIFENFDQKMKNLKIPNFEVGVIFESKIFDFFPTFFRLFFDFSFIFQLLFEMKIVRFFFRLFFDFFFRLFIHFSIDFRDENVRFPPDFFWKILFSFFFFNRSQLQG